MIRALAQNSQEKRKLGKLDGKTAVVTGASRGIGRDMAVVFAREGAKVVVSARTENEGDFRIPGSVAAAVDRIRGEGGEAIGVRCDVTQEDDLAQLFEQASDAFGGIDILVNNAAILIPGRVEDMQVRHWDLLYRVNIRGPFLGCKLVIPHMKARGFGHIINISSVGAIGPGEGPYESARPDGTAYGAGKAHLERFTQGLASELYAHNIAVNALSPRGAIASEGQRWFRGGQPYSGAREDGIIMGDAGAIICAKEPQSYTGKILYDEDVLAEAGITDLSPYPVIP